MKFYINTSHLSNQIITAPTKFNTTEQRGKHAYSLHAKFTAEQILVLVRSSSSDFYELVSCELRRADDVLLDEVDTRLDVLRFKLDKMESISQLLFFRYVIYFTFAVLMNAIY